MMSKPSKNKSSSHDKLEVIYANNLLDETFNSNLEAAKVLDDIQSSISQKPVNPLYVKNSSISKLTLPQASLVEDDRFWREQVKRSDGMANKVTEVQINQDKDVQNRGEEQQIFTFAPTSSSSPDSFTPFKTKKDRIPDDITKWTVSLCGKNLLIVGRNKDGKIPIARVCMRRISGYIFHDSNNIVCALFGPSDLDTNLPQYIREKFKMGIPEDWQNVIEYWQQFIILGCPSKYRWPSPNLSLNSNYLQNYYDTETDYSVVDSNRSSLTTDQLRKKIAKWKKRLDVQILRESMTNSNMGLNHENSVKNDSSLHCQTVQKNNITSVPNKMVNSNVNCEQVNENTFSSIKTASKEQNNVDTLFSRNHSKSETVSFFNKIPVRVESSETANVEKVKPSSEESFHLLLSSDGIEKKRNKTQKKGTEITEQLNSGSDIFSINANKIKPTNNNIQKTAKTSEKNSGTSSFVSLNFSEQSKLSSSTARNTSSKKVLNLEKKTNTSINNSEINLSSRGRARVATLPFWLGSRLLVGKDEKIIIKTSVNDTDVILNPNINTIKKLERNNNSNKSEKSQSETSQEKSHSESSPEKSSEIISKSLDSGVFLKDTNVSSKLNRKQKWNNSETKNSLQQIQSNSSPEKSTESISKTHDSGIYLQPSNTVTNKKTDKKSGKKSEISQSEAFQIIFQSDTSRKSVKDKSNIPDSGEFLKPPDIETIKRRGGKKGCRKNNSQPQEKLSFDSSKESTKNISHPTEEVNLKSKKRSRKKDWNNTQIDKPHSESSLERTQENSSFEVLENCSKLISTTAIIETRTSGRKKGWNSVDESQSPEKFSFNSQEKITESISNSQDSNVFLKPLDVIKKRGGKKGHNKNTSQENLFKLSENSPKVISKTQDPDVCFKSKETEVKKRGTKKGCNKIQGNESQEKKSFCSLEIVNETISKSQDSDVFLKPNIKKRGRNKIQTEKSQKTSEEKSQSESSREKILKVSNSVDESDTVKIPDRKKGRLKNHTLNNESAKSQISQDSIKSISNYSVISAESSTTSVSSRGRIRVPTLQFWQGQRLTVYKNEVVIEQSVNSRCNIESYVNDDLCAEKSIITKSPKKLTNVDVSQNSSSLTYEKVFNETAFKKPENNNTSMVKMQLMSTLRNSLNNNTIHKSKENIQAVKTNSPFETVVIDIENSPNTNKIIRSKLEKSTISSAKRSISPNKTKTKLSKTEENISCSTRGAQTRKQLNFNEETNDKTVKQNKLNKKDDNLKETNESSNSNQLPFRIRSKSESRIKKQLSSSEVTNDRIIETNKSNKNVDNMKETNESLSVEQSPFRRQTRSSSKKLIYDTLLTNSNTSKPLELNENYLKTLSLKNSLNQQINPKLKTYTPKEQKNTLSTRSTRRHSEIITHDMNQIQNEEYKKVEKRSKKNSERNNLPCDGSKKEMIESKKNCRNDSIKNTPNKFKKIVELQNSPRDSKHLQTKPRLLNLKSRLRPKKSTAKNNFNFTVEDITHIEENVPKRSRNNNKEPTKFSVKRTTQFKVTKNTNFPTDTQQLQLMVNKLKKTKKKEPQSDVKIIPKVASPESVSTEPKKRKLFRCNDWMQSEECAELLSQNNPDELQISPKFVIRFNPSVRPQETDDEVFSEISMRV